MVTLIFHWVENGDTYTLKYDQVNNQIFNFYVFSDGFPGHKLSDYTSLHPLKVDTFSELLEIIPKNVLRNLDLVDEEKYKMVQ